MDLVSYKGYTARAEFDGRDKLLIGQVKDISDIIGILPSGDAGITGGHARRHGRPRRRGSRRRSAPA